MGLLWGILVFGELRGHGASLYAQVIGGSVIMAAGAAAIAFSSTSPKEHEHWQAAALRESQRYGTDLDYVRAGLEGRNPSDGRTAEHSTRRTALDWITLAIATLVFVAFASMARTPEVPFNSHAAAILFAVILVILAICGARLWRITRFS